MKIWIQKTIALCLVCVASIATAPIVSAIDVENPEEVVDRISFSGTELIAVLSMLEELTNRSTVRPTALPNPLLYFDSRTSLTRQEAVLAIESILSINGIGVAPMGDKFIKVVDINSITKESPELELGSLRDRPPSGHVVSKLFRLEYLDSQTFQAQIQPFLNPGFSSIIPFENSNAVIVTDTVSNLQRLEYVVSEVDKPSRFNIAPKFYPLQFADAAEVAQQIQRLIDDARSRFGEDSNASNRGTTNRTGPGGRNNRANQGGSPDANAAPPSPFQLGNNSEGSAQNALFGSSTAISSDERTNQIIVITEPSNHTFFDEMIAKFDVRADPATTIEVIRMRHAEAQVVQSILSELVSGETSTDSSDRSQANNNQNTPGNNLGTNNQNNNNQRNNAGNNATNPNRTVTSTSSGEDRETQFSNFMTIVSDERSNSLIVTGTKSDLVAIRALVDEIDVLLPQVRIEVVIIDVNLSKDYARGSDVISAIWDDTFDGTTDANGNPGTNRRLTLGSSSSDGAATSGFNILGLGLGGTNFRIEDGNIADLLLTAVFNRASGGSDVNVISVPTIVTTHNQEATILVGQEEPFVSSTDTGLTAGGTSRTSVSFADVYVELTVTPLIGPNDIIQMTIEQKIDEVASRVNVGGNDTPIIGRREANSFISAKNGELVILGGLQKENLSKTRSRPALLGEIPILGRLFSSRSGDNKKSELMVFIRPTIVRDTTEGEAMAQEKLATSEQAESVSHFLKSGELNLKYQDEKAKAKAEKKKKAEAKKQRGR